MMLMISFDYSCVRSVGDKHDIISAEYMLAGEVGVLADSWEIGDHVDAVTVSSSDLLSFVMPRSLITLIT